MLNVKFPLRWELQRDFMITLPSQVRELRGLDTNINLNVFKSLHNEERCLLAKSGKILKMANAQPETIAARIDSQINARMVEMSAFIGANDFQMLRWEDEIRQLQQADASSAFVLRALISHMRGDIEAMEQHMQAAETLKHATMSSGLARLCAYSNLGFATKALDYFRQCVDIKYGNLSGSAVTGCSIGAFQQVSKLMDQAKLANLELPYFGQLTAMGDAAKVLQRLGITDDQCAKVVDAAGEVLRDRKLFWQDLYPQIAVNEEDGTVSMRMRIDATATEAARMTLETADKLIAQDLDTLPFYVHFLGAKA